MAALYAVYGTLRKGFGNYLRLLNNEHCEYLGTQRTDPQFTMVSLTGFPGVIPGGKKEVTIEVFRVNEPRIERQLDHLEGYPGWYDKIKIQTKWGEANMYVLGDNYLGRKEVESGDWKAYIQGN